MFIINSLVYSPSGSRDSPVMNTLRSWPKFVYLLVQNTPGSQDSSVIFTPWNPYSMVYMSPESIFVNLFWCLFQIHQEVDSLVDSLPMKDYMRSLNLLSWMTWRAVWPLMKTERSCWTWPPTLCCNTCFDSFTLCDRAHSKQYHQPC